MLFKKFRSSSTSKKPATPNLQRHSSPQSDPADDNPKKSPAAVVTRETSKDYENFLEKAKLVAELKEKEMLKMAKEAERRRREFNMDPWTSRI
jgi:hypothetical protein